MKKLLLMALTWGVLLSGNAYATTFFVRRDGGTSAECTGLKDVPKSADKACAFNHPFWAIAPNGSTGVLKGGDTLIIDGGGAQYQIGFGAPNTATCNASWPYDCVMQAIPSGTASQPTKILGKGWDSGCASAPQLWGNERVLQVLNLKGSSNIELQCLDITDHSDCEEFGPKPCQRDNYPFGPWASAGIEAADSSNVLIKKVKIHGFAHTGIHAGRLKDWTLEDVDIVGNAWIGWDGDIGSNSFNSGTMKFTRVRIEWNGCGETYPGLKPANCFSQSQGGYGDGIGTYYTGGNWIFTDCNISHNTSDGIDLLYHDGQGDITITGGRYEGNAGNQIKTGSGTTITNATVIGNCGYFAGQPFTSTKSPGFDNCRAMGNVVGWSPKPNKKFSLNQSTVTSNGDCLVLSGSSACNGTESMTTNKSIFYAGVDFHQTFENSCYHYSDGTCTNLKLNTTNSVVFGAKGSCPTGATCVDPKFVKSCAVTDISCQWNVALQADSPAAGLGASPSGTPPPCVPNGSCSAPQPACGQTTNGVDNCGTPCSRLGSACPPPPTCVPTWCGAPLPVCGQTATGIDECGNPCSKPSVQWPQNGCGGTTPPPPVPLPGLKYDFTSLGGFEGWLSVGRMRGATSTGYYKIIRDDTNPVRYFKMTVQDVTP